MAVLKYLNDHADKEHGYRLELCSDGVYYWIVSYDNDEPTTESEDCERLDTEGVFSQLEFTLMVATGKKAKIDLDDAFYSFVRGIELPVIFEE